MKALEDENAALKEHLAQAQRTPAAPGASGPNPKMAQLKEQLGLDDDGVAVVQDFVSEASKAAASAALESVGLKPGQKITQPAPAAPAAPAAPVAPAPAEEVPNLSDDSWDLFYTYIPDFDQTILPHIQANGNRGSEQLNAFFSQQEELTGYTFGQLAQQATIADDPTRLANIYKTFKRFLAKPGRPERPLAPNSGKAGQNLQPTEKPKLSRAEYEKFEKDYQKNIGSWTVEQRAEAQKKLDEYELAAQEGRLI